MKKNLFSLLGRLFLLLSLGCSFNQTHAQYLFSQSFANAGVLSSAGWQVYSPKGTSFRDTVNGLAQPGIGSLHVSFTAMRSGDIDTVTVPAFTPTTNDSVIFDHAHRAKLIGSDSMAIWSSTDGGITFSYLASYAGNSLPSSTSLSTVSSTIAPGKFRPTNSSMWAHKAVALPVGTNRIQFIFYSDGGDELYLDNIMVGKDPMTCTGTPATAILPTTLIACNGSDVIINGEVPPYDPYLTYQWEVSLDSGNTDPWTPVANIGGINSPDFFLTNFSQAAYYRLEITCAGSTSTSAGAHVVFDSSYNCYCRSNLGGACIAWINQVSIAGTDLNNSSSCDDLSAGEKFTFYPPSAFTSDSITAGDPLVTINIGTALFSPYASGQVGFWIDYDKSGTYDPAEFIRIDSFLADGVQSRTFAVPVNAAPGYTGLRVRTIGAAFATFDGTFACSNIPDGETEDYLIYINPAPVCSGTPVAGTLTASASDICSTESFSITASGMTFGSSVTYEWEESDDNGVTDPWTTASGSGIYTPALQVAGLTDTMYYRLKVVCGNTPDSSYSASTVINVKPFYMCYCSSALGGNACDRGTSYISNVSVAASTINNTTLCSNNANSYTYYDPISLSVTDTFNQGEMINIQVTNTEVSNKIGVWIDYDQNGTYDNSEFTLIDQVSVPNIASSANIEVSSSALTGYTGMRIRAVGQGERFGSGSACSNFGSGETEDYVIYIEATPSCSGTPDGGHVPPQVSVCNGQTVNIEALGSSYGPDITYQWEVSVDAGTTDPWTTAFSGGGVTTRQLKTPNITDTVYYRLKVSCATSLTDAYSDTVEVVLNPFYNCYCNDDLGAGGTCARGEYISNVSILGGNLNNSSTCVSVGSDNNYSNYAPTGTATDTVKIGDLVDLSVTYAGSLAKIGVWIDYDQSGSFDAAEFTLMTSTTAMGNPAVKTIEIPTGVMIGQTGMRIRSTCFSCQLDPGDACANVPEGETEDYIINIDTAITCSGTPVAGTIPSSYLICANKPFDITAATAVYNNGITYQWEESDDNGVSDPWSDVVGSTSRVLSLHGITSDKYFRMKALCNNTQDSTYTNVMYMPVDSFYNCYDAGTDLGGSGCYGNNYINEISIQKTTLDNSSTCNVTPFGARTTFPASGSSTATLVGSVPYDISISKNSSVSIGVWIDYDRSGTFDPVEFTLVSAFSFGISTETATILIPSNITPGVTGMRVRTNQPIAFGGIMAPNTAAFNYAEGETEDYVITLDTLKPVTNATVNNISSNDITVSWTNGNGIARVVLAKEVSTLLTEPVDGNEFFSPDRTFASGNGDSTAAGNYIVFNSDRDTFVTVLGLNPFTQYEFYVYEYLNSHTTGTIYSAGQMATGTTLPVNMLSFNAAKKQQDVLLNWSTASEINNKGFTVERSKTKGQWEYVGSVEGKGNSTTITKYSLTDPAPFTSGISTIYYRLRQEDFDGKATYSSVVSVSTGNSKPSVALYPNPFRESITLTIQSEKQAELHITVRDIFGKTVAETTMATDKGNTTLTLDQLSHLADGIYFLQVEQQGEVQNFKVTKTR